MPGSPAALAEAILQAQSILGTVWDMELQQSTLRAVITRGHPAARVTAWTRDHHGVTAAGTFPVSSPWLHSRSWPQGFPENISSSDTNGYSSHPSLLSRHLVSPAPPPQH